MIPKELRARWDRELERFYRYYDRVMAGIPGARQQALYAAGKTVQKDVQDQVDRQGVRDGFGRVSAGNRYGWAVGAAMYGSPPPGRRL